MFVLCCIMCCLEYRCDLARAIEKWGGPSQVAEELAYKVASRLSRPTTKPLSHKVSSLCRARLCTDLLMSQCNQVAIHQIIKTVFFKCLIAHVRAGYPVEISCQGCYCPYPCSTRPDLKREEQLCRTQKTFCQKTKVQTWAPCQYPLCKYLQMRRKATQYTRGTEASKSSTIQLSQITQCNSQEGRRPVQLVNG